MAPLVDQQWRWFGVSRFDPGWEEASLVCLIPQVLVKVGVSDLLQGLHIIHRNQVAVQVHELNADLVKMEVMTLTEMEFDRKCLQ